MAGALRIRRDRGVLQRTAHVLGVGGGRCLDAGQFVAGQTGATFISIPTIVSTGAVFQSAFPARREGKLYLVAETVVPLHTLFDTDIIHAAPAHLNAAGMAECVCLLAGVASWRWWCEQGLDGPAWDQGAADEVENWVRSRVDRYTADLDNEGRPGPEAIRTCAEVNRERFELGFWKLKALHGIDHLFDNTYSWVQGRNLIHAEAVALGTLINAVLCGSTFDQARTLLERCGTRYKPSQISCTWPQVRSTLEAIPEHADHLEWPESWLHYGTLDDATFDEIVRRIEPVDP